MKAVLKQVFHFYLYGNFHIALCAAALCFTTGLVLHVRIDPYLIGFLSCCTLALYTLQRVLSFRLNVGSKDFYMQGRLLWMKKNEIFLWAIMIGSVICGLLFSLNTGKGLLHKQEDLLKLSIIPAIFSLLYAIPVFRKNGKWFRLRDVPGIKIFLVAGTWAFVTVIIPSFYAYQPAAWGWSPEWFNAYRISWFIQSFLFLFALTIPFDIRDLEFDKVKLKTIPALIGENKAKALAIGLLICAIAVRIITDYLFDSSGNFPHLGKQGLAFGAWSVCAGIAIWKMSSRKTGAYADLVIDGQMLILALFFWLAEII